MSLFMLLALTSNIFYVISCTSEANVTVVLVLMCNEPWIEFRAWNRVNDHG